MAATTRFISLVYVLLWTAILCFSLSSFTLYKDSVTWCYKKPSRLSRHLVHTCVNPASISVSTLWWRVCCIKSSPVMSLEARVLLFLGISCSNRKTNKRCRKLTIPIHIFCFKIVIIGKMVEPGYRLKDFGLGTSSSCRTLHSLEPCTDSIIPVLKWNIPTGEGYSSTELHIIPQPKFKGI